MTEKQTFDDVANAEINAVEASIKEAKEDLRRTNDRIHEYNNKRQDIEEYLDRLATELTRAKKQATRLKKHVWVSDNPNIVELRNELLLLTKLTVDNDQSKGK